MQSYQPDRFSIKPTEKQAEFITDTSKFSCYSGGFGAGKTWAGCMRGLLLSQIPNNRGLIGRYTYPELRTTTRATFFELCPPEYYDPKQGGVWNKSENYLRLINGSEILFIHLDTASEKELLSLNLGWFFIDQAEEIGEKVFHVLQSRLRLATVPKRFGFLACNPDPGSWIYDRFQKPVIEGKPHPDYMIINSSSQDNPYLPTGYIETLKESYSEDTYKRYVEGKWEVFENAIYKDYSSSIHVIKPFEIPKKWELLVTLDHGMTNPTAVTLSAIDYDGNIFIIDEYYEAGQVVSEHSRAIKQMTANYNISYWLIDPSTRAKTREKDGMPWSVLEEYEDNGLYFVPANNQLLGGINRVSEFLRTDEKRIHPTTGRRGSPRLFIFQNCVNLIQEFPRYEWRRLRGFQRRNLPEVPTDYNDHLLDCVRYTIMSRFPPPSKRPMGDEIIPPAHRVNMNDMAKHEDIKGGNELGGFYKNYQPLSTDNYE